MLIRAALPHEAPLIQELIHELAVFEKAPESAQASLAHIEGAFFAAHPAVFCDLVEDEEGEHIDSCWGFYGFDHCKQEARSAAEYAQEQMLKGLADSVICVGMSAAV